MSRIGVWALFVWLAACSAPSPFPDMQRGETGRVVNVIDGDALVLDTGQSVRLVSIEAPALYPRERDPDPYSAESARVLEDLALGRQVQLFYPGLTRDRYDRALAHVMTADGAGPRVWLNAEMLKSGAAWVRLYPDTAARGQDLLVLERAAREAELGLWRTARYAVREASDVTEGAQGFMLIQAELGEALPVPDEMRYPPACLRALVDAEITISIRRDARTSCGLASGTRVLVRGYVSNGVLDLTYPRHLELTQVP